MADGYEALREVTETWTALHALTAMVIRTGKPATYTMMTNGQWGTVEIRLLDEPAKSAVKAGAP